MGLTATQWDPFSGESQAVVGSPAPVLDYFVSIILGL